MDLQKLTSLFKGKTTELSSDATEPDVAQKEDSTLNEQSNSKKMDNKDTGTKTNAFNTFTDLNTPEEIKFLEQLILYRLHNYFPSKEKMSKPVLDIDNWSVHLKDFIIKHNLSEDESTLILIALAPHIQSDLFDKLIEYKLESSSDFQKIGGVRGRDFRGFLPTGETAIFLLGDDDFARRLEIQKLFWADHLFEKGKILWLDEPLSGEPAMSGKIILSSEYLDTFIYGKPMPPRFSMSFPARLIPAGELTWDDLVINDELKGKINELKSWLTYNEQLVNEWGMGDRLKKGYRTLFYGPSGTGKTFTAGLLGKEVNKDVYKIDLSMVVSKYIGETEKNLELLFARAEDKGWILFFDEADALFGKRTNVRDAHDKYANQEVSYLLQRIEDYNGMVILATNMKSNIDDAFMRRFNSVLKFSLPDVDERAKIWQLAFPDHVRFCKEHIQLGNNGKADNVAQNQQVNIPEIVKNYPISGGSIVNVVHYASIKAMERHCLDKDLLAVSKNGNGNKDKTSKSAPPTNDAPQKTIYLTDVLDGIKKELLKEGKPFN